MKVCLLGVLLLICFAYIPAYAESGQAFAGTYTLLRTERLLGCVCPDKFQIIREEASDGSVLRSNNLYAQAMFPLPCVMLWVEESFEGKGFSSDNRGKKILLSIRDGVLLQEQSEQGADGSSSREVTKMELSADQLIVDWRWHASIKAGTSSDRGGRCVYRRTE